MSQEVLTATEVRKVDPHPESHLAEQQAARSSRSASVAAAPELGANAVLKSKTESPEANQVVFGRRVPWWRLVLGAAIFVVGGATLWIGAGLFRSPHAHDSNVISKEGRPDADIAIPVNTVTPRRKTLERKLDQPGTIRPWAQAELYAKVSGYLDYILCQPADGPEIDIGSPVREGEELVRVDVPELEQDIIEGKTFIQQREAELDEARSTLEGLKSSVELAKAQLLLAEADVEKAESDLAYRTAQFGRIEQLVKDGSVSADNLDEAHHQFRTVRAALRSSQAKEKSAQAEISIVSSKLATAEVDVRVKEALFQAAKDKLQRAKILADYASLQAPFNGIISFRGVDKGDFVQNASSGQARHLLTVTSLDKVKVVLQVREADAVWVEVGAEAVVTVDARASWRGEGRVARIGHVLEGQSRTMQVEIDLDNPGHLLKPGMYGQVSLTLQKIPNAQALPATVVYSRKNISYILQVHDGVVERHQVRLRYDDGKEVEVVKIIGDKEVPLNGSEELIVSNKGEIAEGQRVQATRLKDN